MYQTFNKIVNSISGSLEFNTSTFSGCMDVIVIKHSANEFKSSPFHLRFGTMKIFKVGKEKEVKLYVNDQQVQGVKMIIGTQGDAYFVEKVYRGVARRKRRSSCNIEDISHDQELDQEDTNSKKNNQNTDDPNQKNQIQNHNQINDQKENENVDENDNLSEKSIKTEVNEKKKKRQRLRSMDRFDTLSIEEDSNQGSSKWWFFGKNKDKQQPNSSNKCDKEEHQQNKRNIDNIHTNSVQSEKNYEQMKPIDDAEMNQLVNEILIGNQEKKKGIMGSFFGIFRNNSNKDQQHKQESLEQQSQINDNNINNSTQSTDNYDIQLSLCGNRDLDQIDQYCFQEYLVTKEQFFSQSNNILSSDHLIVKFNNQYYPWKVALPHIVSMLVFKQNFIPTQNSFNENILQDQQNQYFNEQKQTQDQEQEQQKEQDQQKEQQQEQQKEQEQQQDEEQKQKTEQEQGQQHDDTDLLSESGKSYTQSQNTLGGQQQQQQQQQQQYRVIKTKYPSSDSLQQMCLKEGYNKVMFEVQSRLTGVQQIQGAIYMWNHAQKVVISDIDGTITKSDVLGQLYPLVNKNYCHEYITNLLTNIYKNNYKIIYLTARALVQSTQTRDFIDQLNQKQETLPPGPVIMSPDGLIPSFKREVIYKKPEIFKIAALRDIKALFSIQSPFYAGFGNRDTDALAYKAVGVSLNRIFLVNPKGEVYGINNTYKKDYQALNTMVDSMFPYSHHQQEVLDKYNQNNYWANYNYYDVDINIEDFI